MGQRWPLPSIIRSTSRFPALPAAYPLTGRRTCTDHRAGPNSLRLGEAAYGVLRPAGFSDQATVGIVYALLTYILGFVALEIPRAGTDPQTSDEFVRRLHAFFAALPPGAFPYTVDLAPLLARISTDDQFQFGIGIFLAGLQAQQPTPKHST
jgi:Tetracyclin repressor-like, C-terminal domain